MPNETASNAKRLVQEHKTPIVFTPHSGGVMALQVFNEAEKFIIGAYTSEPKITQTGNSLTVRIPPRYDSYVAPFTQYAMKRFGKKLAALPTSSQYGKDWSDTLLPYWEKQGGKVVYKTSIDFSKDTDFFTIVTNALKEKPDVLFIGGPSEPTAKVAKQARELGFKGGFIIMDQAKLDEMKKVTGSYDMLEGAIGVMPLVESDGPGVPSFVKNYRAKFNEDPGSEAGFNYLALYVFVEAMKAAGTVDDATAIRQHMPEGLKNLPKDKQVYAVLKIDGNGGLESLQNIAAVENGKIVPIKIKKYAFAYGNNQKMDNYSIRKTLDHTSIWFVPMVNPDGVTLVQRGYKAVKNSNLVLKINRGKKDFSAWKANIRGVDLNRQYDAYWKTICCNPGKPWYKNYKGPRPYSEPEAQAMRDFTLAHNFLTTVSYHSSGQIIYWHFHQSKTQAQRDYRLALMLSKKTKYSLVKPTKNPSGGGYKDWFVIRFKRPGFTIEVAPYVGERPVPLKYFPSIWNKNNSVPIILANSV
ncbi:ABC-type branched-chain amino acid transport system, substrate-binding protein [Parageobacillus thermantarcticus]|uniref:ABC-type branched-chain amino acid transport system, substrate-binding protein n=2 Tax=Parageobacillus thermantarcticus TaxID=186116 RepID=A0A1I0TTL4_9BACL|nr:ABC-type branched-chain amino acid transport system, substrate-binding protein [Parageobacillus thermantarcticus]